VVPAAQPQPSPQAADNDGYDSAEEVRAPAPIVRRGRAAAAPLLSASAASLPAPIPPQPLPPLAYNSPAAAAVAVDPQPRTSPVSAATAPAALRLARPCAPPTRGSTARPPTVRRQARRRPRSRPRFAPSRGCCCRGDAWRRSCGVTSAPQPQTQWPTFSLMNGCETAARCPRRRPLRHRLRRAQARTPPGRSRLGARPRAV